MKTLAAAAFVITLAVLPASAGGETGTASPVHLSASQILAQTSPAIVSIMAQHAVPPSEPDLRVAPFSEHFSGLPGQDLLISRNLGAGIIVNGRLGYVVTSSQVAATGQDFLVGLSDGRQVEAKKVGKDLVSSVAVLQISAGNLSELTLDAKLVPQVGDPVLALGRDPARGLIATSGIISALPSVGHEQGALDGLLETDAAITDELAGGPLVDAQGRLVGVNVIAATPLLARKRAISYAIPAAKAVAALKQLVAFGEIRHATLQLTVQDLDPETAKIKGLGLDAGALVIEVPADSAAGRAGIKVGDVIAAVEDEAVANAEQLKRKIWELPANTTVTLSVIRSSAADHFKAIVATADRSADANSGGSMAVIRLADGPGKI